MIVSIDDFMYNGKIKDIKDGEAIDLRATAAVEDSERGYEADHEFDIVIRFSAIFKNNKLDKFKVENAYNSETEEKYQISPKDKNFLKTHMKNLKVSNIREI